MRQRHILALLLCAVALTATAQRPVNVWEWGIARQVTPDSITFNKPSGKAIPDTMVSISDASVDLSLSVEWAVCNIGATKPEEAGDYLAWGETEPKDNYTYDTYKFWSTADNAITKYNSTDGLKVLEPDDDAAHVRLGGDWRMPTKAEAQELIDKCTWTWVRVNGILGYLVTGASGKSIFLPAQGTKSGKSVWSVGRQGWFWTSTLYPSGNSDGKLGASLEAYAERKNDHKQELTTEYEDERCLGLTVRAVRPVRPTDVIEYVDLGLPSGLKWAAYDLGATKAGERGSLYAWGETAPKDTFTTDNYEFGTFRQVYSMTSSDSYRTVLLTLRPADDAAFTHLGSPWRMPTADEARELVKYCKFETVTIDSIVCTKATGPNGNYVIFPNDEQHYNQYGNQTTTGTFWTSSTHRRSPSNTSIAFEARNDNMWTCGPSDDDDGDPLKSYLGYHIRPVCP